MLPSRGHGQGRLAGCILSTSVSVLATYLDTCLHFFFFKKTKTRNKQTNKQNKGKKEAWLTAVEHETSETRARLATQPHREKKILD